MIFWLTLIAEVSAVFTLTNIGRSRYETARELAVAEDDGEFATHDADGVTMEIAFCAKGLAQRTGAMEALYAVAHATDVR